MPSTSAATSHGSVGSLRSAGCPCASSAIASVPGHEAARLPRCRRSSPATTWPPAVSFWSMTSSSRCTQSTRGAAPCGSRSGMRQVRSRSSATTCSTSHSGSTRRWSGSCRFTPTTICAVSSTAATRHFADAFRLPPERFTSALGLPRTDAFFDAPGMARAGEAIRRRYDLPADRHLLLYARPSGATTRVMRARPTPWTSRPCARRSATSGCCCCASIPLWATGSQSHPSSRALPSTCRTGRT